MPPLGCLPHIRLVKKAGGHGSCWDEPSALVRLHNKLLPGALQKLADKLQGFKYTVGDTYTMLQNRIDNPSKYGKFLNSFDLNLFPELYFHFFFADPVS